MSRSRHWHTSTFVMGEVRTSAGLRPALAASLTSSTASSRSSFSSASLPIILLYLGRSFFGTTPLYRKHARVRERVRRPWRRGRAPRQAQVYQSAKRTNAQPGKTLPPPHHWGPHQCARLRTPYAAYTHTHTSVCVLSCARCAWWPMGASPGDLHVRQRVADLLEGEREAMRG